MRYDKWHFHVDLSRPTLITPFAIGFTRTESSEHFRIKIQFCLPWMGSSHDFFSIWDGFFQHKKKKNIMKSKNRGQKPIGRVRPKKVGIHSCSHQIHCLNDFSNIPIRNSAGMFWKYRHFFEFCSNKRSNHHRSSQTKMFGLEKPKNCHPSHPIGQSCCFQYPHSPDPRSDWPEKSEPKMVVSWDFPHHLVGVWATQSKKMVIKIGKLFPHRMWLKILARIGWNQLPSHGLQQKKGHPLKLWIPFCWLQGTCWNPSKLLPIWSQHPKWDNLNASKKMMFPWTLMATWAMKKNLGTLTFHEILVGFHRDPYMVYL